MSYLCKTSGGVKYLLHSVANPADEEKGVFIVLAVFLPEGSKNCDKT